VRAPNQIVCIDRDRIRQALDNLLDNAARHARHGGEVIVEADVAPGTVRISVENAGDPFPDWLLPRAFEPFVTGADDDGDGAGLGLAIVRATAIAHGGDAVVENLAGSGARVAIMLATDDAAGVRPPG
jgi:signal transduction histidine kinase